MLISDIATKLVVNLAPDDEYILISYKVYEDCIELVDFKRKKRGVSDDSKTDGPK